MPGNAGELLGHVERLREELLDLAGAGHRELVFVGQFVDAQNGDDVLQILVALQHSLHQLGGVVVVVAQDDRIENARRGSQRIDRRINAQCRDVAREVRRRVEVRERRRRSRIGVVVGGHVDRLHRCDGSVLRGRDALLQFAHFGCQVGLVAHGGRHAAQQRRHFRTGLCETENIVDEQQHVLVFFVAEIFGDGQPGQAHTQARSGRLGHLTVDQRALGLGVVVRIDDARFLHFQPQIVAFAGALAHAGEDRHAAVLHGDVVDQLHDDDGLADARAAEQSDLAAAQIRLEQVDHLDAGLEHFEPRRLVFERGRRPVNRDSTSWR